MDRMNRRRFLESATLAASGALLPGAAWAKIATFNSSEQRTSAVTNGLRALGDAAGIQISASISPGIAWAEPPIPSDWDFPALDAIMRADLHAVCAANFNPAAVMRWNNRPKHPARLSYGSDEPEHCVTYARAAGLGIATFAGIWQEEIPEWLTSAPDRATAITEMRAYLQELAKFKGQTLWHRAVNECIDFWHGGGVNHMVTENRTGAPNAYYTKIGPDYPELAFQALRELDPEAKLVLNQYGLWEAGRQGQYDEARGWMLQTIDRFQNKGINIDYVGVQSHFVPGHKEQGFDEARFAKFLDNVAARGVQILMTELDSADTFLADRDVAVRDEKCAAEAKRVLDVALENKAVIGINLARLTDWLSYFEGDFDRPASTASGAKVRAFPYDAALRKKPLWDALAAALRKRAG
jgi:endo-1,4-beta-xylanase